MKPLTPVVFTRARSSTYKPQVVHLVINSGVGWFRTYCGLERSTKIAEKGTPEHGALCSICREAAHRKHD